MIFRTQPRFDECHTSFIAIAAINAAQPTSLRRFVLIWSSRYSGCNASKDVILIVLVQCHLCASLLASVAISQGPFLEHFNNVSQVLDSGLRITQCNPRDRPAVPGSWRRVATQPMTMSNASCVISAA